MTAIPLALLALVHVSGSPTAQSEGKRILRLYRYAEAHPMENRSWTKKRVTVRGLKWIVANDHNVSERDLTLLIFAVDRVPEVGVEYLQKLAANKSDVPLKRTAVSLVDMALIKGYVKNESDRRKIAAFAEELIRNSSTWDSSYGASILGRIQDPWTIPLLDGYLKNPKLNSLAKDAVVRALLEMKSHTADLVLAAYSTELRNQADQISSAIKMSRD